MKLLADQEECTCRSIELPNFFDKSRTDISAAINKNSFPQRMQYIFLSRGVGKGRTGREADSNKS